MLRVKVLAGIAFSILVLVWSSGCDTCPIRCRDGSCSDAKNRQGACSWHGGIANEPGVTTPAAPAAIPNVSLGYELTLAPGDQLSYKAVLTLNWRSANGVGFRVEALYVRMRDSEGRTLLQLDETAEEIISIWGTTSVPANGSRSRAFEIEFDASSAYVGAIISTAIVDDLGIRHTPELGLGRTGFGSTGGG